MVIADTAAVRPGSCATRKRRRSGSRQRPRPRAPRRSSGLALCSRRARAHREAPKTPSSGERPKRKPSCDCCPDLVMAALNAAARSVASLRRYLAATPCRWFLPSLPSMPLPASVARVRAAPDGRCFFHAVFPCCVWRRPSAGTHSQRSRGTWRPPLGWGSSSSTGWTAGTAFRGSPEMESLRPSGG